MEIKGLTPAFSWHTTAFIPHIPAAREPSISLPTQDSKVLTPLAQVTISHQLNELSFQAGYTQFAYQRRDGSAAARVSSSLNLKSREETMMVSVVFIAEALGLDENDFIQTGGEPIQLKFTYRQETRRLVYQSKTQLIKTLRKPEAILGDLVAALREIAKEDKGKLVRLVFDEEAIKVLAGDAKVRELISELLLLINALGILEGKDGRKAYTIYLSGKGKPILDHQENLEIETQAQEISFELTILPPSQSIKRIESSEITAERSST